MAATPTKTQRTFEGMVVSDKMDKTVVVLVESTKVHPKYGKRYKRSTKFKVHDEKNEYKVGDVIGFRECRPISKDKCWIATGKVK